MVEEQERLETLQAQIHTLQAELKRHQKRVGNAWRRLEEVEECNFALRPQPEIPAEFAQSAYDTSASPKSVLLTAEISRLSVEAGALATRLAQTDMQVVASERLAASKAEIAARQERLARSEAQHEATRQNWQQERARRLERQASFAQAEAGRAV